MNNQLKLSVLDLVPRFGEYVRRSLATGGDIGSECGSMGLRATGRQSTMIWSICPVHRPRFCYPISALGPRAFGSAPGPSGAHYSPLKVAENFRMLAALYPGRIDLGIGRAPGGSAHTSMALSGNFLGHVADLPQRIRALTELLEDRYRYEDVPVLCEAGARNPARNVDARHEYEECGLCG